MHNGEKGLWEKWSLFDESTHVPLMIYDPASPYKGRHYPEPVELVDVYPTILDLLRIPLNNSAVCKPAKGCATSLPSKQAVIQHCIDLTPSTSRSWIDRCIPLQGKSLARIVMGNQWASFNGSVDRARGDLSEEMPLLSNSFAISQMWRCSTEGKGYSVGKNGTVVFNRKSW